jgi:Mn2+/Fe2+ NRAMP family transporter
MVTHQWGQVLEHTLIPHIEFNKGYIALLVAILGTTISPYLFFWQSAHRLEEMREEPEDGDNPQPLKDRSRARAKLKERTSRVDVFSGMAFSNIVMFAIIATTAATLHAHHMTNIQSAAQAAQALKPLVGHLSSPVFALGFVGSGRWVWQDCWAKSGASLDQFAKPHCFMASWLWARLEAPR